MTLPTLDITSLLAVKDLSIASRMVLDGFMNGINKSAIKGQGIEFRQYRSYQPGDDLKWLDWKMFARSDRYYIRESEIETNISIRILVDASASMMHQDQGFTKIQYARLLAASFAYLAQLQGDAFGLYIFKDKEIFNLPAKQDFQHLSRIFFHLEQIKPGGKFSQPIHYKDIYSGSRKRELLLFITDLYQEEDEIYKLLDSLNALKNEILVFQVMGKNELDLNFQGYTVLEDLENGKQVKIDQSSFKKEYQQQLDLHIQKIKSELLDRNIDYTLIPMDKMPDIALRKYLNQRNKARSF